MLGQASPLMAVERAVESNASHPESTLLRASGLLHSIQAGHTAHDSFRFVPMARVATMMATKYNHIWTRILGAFQDILEFMESKLMRNLEFMYS